MSGKCAKLMTKATIVALDGRRFVGTNSVNNPQKKCPREGMPTGVGYELCKSVCDQPAHAEVAACLAAGDAARGGKLYLEGHYYACDNCKRVAAEHGVEIVIGKPPRNGRSVAKKGYSFENECRHAALNAGLHCRRVPLSGAGEEKGDICITASWDQIFRCELKRRKALPEWIVKALGDHDAMVMRGDRGRALAVIPFETLLELLQ